MKSNIKKSVKFNFRRITEAIAEQSGILGHVSGAYEHPKMYEYVEALVSKMPGDLKVGHVKENNNIIYVCSSAVVLFNDKSGIKYLTVRKAHHDVTH